MVLKHPMPLSIIRDCGFKFISDLNTFNVSIENLTAAPANIKNGNIAKEVTELTKQQLMVQSSETMVDWENLI
jgi:hypothetical protein